MDWLFSDPSMPHGLKMLVWVAVSLAALAYIARVVRGFARDKMTQAVLKAISHEVHNNNGESLKDRAEQALREAREARQEATKAREVSESTDRKVDWLMSHLVGRVPTPEEIARNMQAMHHRGQ